MNPIHKKLLPLALMFSHVAFAGEFLVKVDSQPKSFGLLASQLQARVLRQLPGTEIFVVEKSDSVDSLLKAPGVLAAEPNRVIQIDSVPNDPRFKELWGMKNDGQIDGGGQEGTPGIDLGLEKAWELGTGSSQVVVAVIDTGIDLTHPDLVDNLWTHSSEALGQAGVDDDGNGYVDDLHGYDFIAKSPEAQDDNRHGTHVAGTIGARGDNSVGVTGVNWNVSLMALKAFDKKGTGRLDAMIEAIHYAVRNGAQVINASWGMEDSSDLLKEAIAEAADQGVLFVAAAGNESANNDQAPRYPASYALPNVISVAAVDNLGALAEFSCYGKKTVHLAAPGVSILSTVIKGRYQRISGTSMAAPHVSGIAALLLAQEPGLTPVEIKKRLIRSSTPVPSLKDRVVARGIVNAYSALLEQAAYW